MSNKFRISHSQSVQLPNKCILCGAHPRTEYKISGSTLSGASFYLLFTGVKYETMSIPAPVCLKHYYVILLMRILLAVSFVVMIPFGIPLFISVFLHELDGFPAFMYIILFVSIAIFILSLKFQPIKLKNIGEHFFTLIIRNDEYADEFSLINNIKKT